MKITGLDGKTHIWNLTNYVPSKDDNKPCSQYHVRARSLLTEEFPCDRILEEVGLPGCGLFADFYIPKRKLMIEVHGSQHYEFNSFFFKSKADFYKAQARDRQKANWANINNITYIELPYTESDNEWRARIFDDSQG
tara:strand:+ start:108 stop:518 length:411 start_codon:yes stop_codon:yes gene_type:complete